MTVKYKINSDVFVKKRQILNLTQAQVAFKAGITEKTYRDIESGKRTPRQDTLAQLMKILELSSEELYIFNNAALSPSELDELQRNVDKELQSVAQRFEALYEVQKKACMEVDGYTVHNTVFLVKSYLTPLLLQTPFSITEITTTIMNFVKTNGCKFSIYQNHSHFPIMELGNLLKSRQNKIRVLDHPDVEREIGIMVQYALSVKMPNEYDQNRFGKLIDKIEEEQISLDPHARAETILHLYLFLATHWEELYRDPSYYHALAMICVVLEDPIIDPDDLQNYALTLRAISMFLLSCEQANLEMRMNR